MKVEEPLDLRRRWTEEEDSVFRRIVINGVKSGKPLKDIFAYAAYRHERTEAAVTFHYYSEQEQHFRDIVNRLREEYKEANPESKTQRPASQKPPKQWQDVGDDDDEYEIADLGERVIEQRKSIDIRYTTPKLPPTASESEVEQTIDETPIYDQVREAMLDAQRRQVAYGLKKYPEPLNADTWTILETIDHIIEETTDKLHYLTMLKIKIQNELEA